MSQVPQILFHSQLPTSRPRFTVRNSDDFFPNEPSSHSWHIFCNAHNSVLTQYLNVIPDWDMFQTNHLYSAFHAAARCVSGGPICFTDKPGEHNVDLIDRVTARAPVKRIILRPDVGKSTQVYHAHKDQAFCRIGTICGPKDIGSSILGIYNVGNSLHSEMVALKDFINVLSNRRYIVHAHISGRIASPLRLEDDDRLMLLPLEHWGFEILTAHALQSFAFANGHPTHCTEIAVLGLLDKMTGAAAVGNVQMVFDGNPIRLRVKVNMKALGTLGD